MNKEVVVPFVLSIVLGVVATVAVASLTTNMFWRGVAMSMSILGTVIGNLIVRRL